MFFVLPIGVEGFKVRIPIVSIVLAVLCVLAFLGTWVLNPAHDDDDGAPSALQSAFQQLLDHPYLDVPPDIAKHYLRPSDVPKLKALRERWLENNEMPPSSIVEGEQRELNERLQAAIAQLDKDPMRKWAFVPGRGLAQPGLVTHLFLHFGWLHLLGNLLFLALCAPMLEDAWGRMLFGVFYFVGGLAAVLAHFALDHHSMAPMAGASGAIAACMGAFAVRFAQRRVLLAYIIFVGFRFFRGVWRWPAWVCGVLWFGGQMLDFVTDSASGVAVMAHLGGFAFGAAASFGMKALGLENDLLASSELDEQPLLRSYSRDVGLAQAALKQGDVDSARQHFKKVFETDTDAAVGLIRLDYDSKQDAAAMRKLDALLTRLARSNDEMAAREVTTEFWPRLDVGQLKPSVAATLAKMFDDAHGMEHIAIPLYERGGDTAGFAGVKSLIRAVEMHLGQRNADAAAKALSRVEKRPANDLAPFNEQVNSLRPQVKRLATLDVLPVSGEHRMPDEAKVEASRKENDALAAPTSGKREAEIIPCMVMALNTEGIVVELDETGSLETIEWVTMVAIAVGAVPRPPESGRAGGHLLVDLIVSHATEQSGPRSYRFDSDTTAMGTLFPAPTPPESYRAFVSAVLQRTNIVALPDLMSLMKGEFTKYASVAARDAALLSAA